MLDPLVHGAIVTLAVWFINWLFGLLGLNLGSEIVTSLATVLVGYILSLFGYSLYARGVHGTKADGYRPPFT